MKKRRYAAQSRPRAKRAGSPLPSRAKLLAGGLVALGLLGVVVLLWPASPDPIRDRSVQAPLPPPPKPHIDPKPKPPLPRPPEKPNVDQDDGQDPFEKRLTEKRARASDLVAQHQEALKEARQEREAALKELMGGPVWPLPKPGQGVPNGKFESFLDGLGAVQNATLHLIRGRFFSKLERWEKARDAFERAVELDDRYEDLLGEICTYLDHVIAGEVPLHGRVQRFSRDRLQLSYEFEDGEGLKDFSPAPTESDGVATFPPSSRPVMLVGGDTGNPIAFQGAISLKMNVVAEGDITLLFFHQSGSGYELSLTKDGTALHRVTMRAGGTRAKVKLAGSRAGLALKKEQDLRVEAADGRIRFSLENRVIFSVADSEAMFGNEPGGAIGFESSGGPLKIHGPLIVRGRIADPAKLKYRVRGPEALRRLLIDPDLREIQMLRERILAGIVTREFTLSAEDWFFQGRIRRNDIPRWFPRIRDQVLGGLTSDEAREAEEELSLEITRAKKRVPSLHYLRAVLLMGRGENRAALEEVRTALEEFPDFAEALVLKARLMLASGSAKSVVAPIVERALKAKPDLAAGYVLRATLDTKWRTAEQDLRLALEIDRDNLEAWLVLGRLKLQYEGLSKLGCVYGGETDHYRIETDIRDAAPDYGKRLEEAFRVFARSFKGRFRNPDRKPSVVIFSNPENYYIYWELLNAQRGEETGGVYLPDVDVLALFEGLDRIDTQHVLYHEAFHHFMTLLLPSDSAPHWLNEGLAEHMGSVVGDSSGRGRILPDRLLAIQMALRNPSIPRDTFRQIMLRTPREFMGPGVALRYAQSWAMVRFLQEKRRDLMTRYIAALRNGSSQEQAYQDVFASEVARLEPAWATYVLGLRPPVSIEIPDPQPPEASPRKAPVEKPGPAKPPKKAAAVPDASPVNATLAKAYGERKKTLFSRIAEDHFRKIVNFLRGAGMYKTARDECSRVIKLDPKHRGAQGLLKSTKPDAKKLDAAMESRLASLRKEVETSRAREWGKLGKWCVDKKLVNEAKEAYREVRKYAPGNREALRALGYAKGPAGAWLPAKEIAIRRRMKDGLSGAEKGTETENGVVPNTSLPTVRRESANFVLESTVLRQHELENLIRHAEHSFALFREIFGVEDPFGTPSEKMTHLILKDEAEHFAFVDGMFRDRMGTAKHQLARASTGTIGFPLTEMYRNLPGGRRLSKAELEDWVVHATLHACSGRLVAGSRHWIHEGLAYYFTRLMKGSAETRCVDLRGTGPDTKGKNLQDSKTWRTVVATMVKARRDPEINAVLTCSKLPELSTEEVLKAWSLVDFLLVDYPEEFVALCRELKGKTVPDDILRAVVNVFGWGTDELDDRWRRYVRFAYD